MSEKLKVGILGATGMVGQRFITLLADHPFFEITTLAASASSAGKTYEESVGGRWKMDAPMPEAVKQLVIKDVKDVAHVASEVDFVFSAVNMSKDEIRAIEEEYAKTETPVVSNNSAHRWTPDVPMVIPEINPQHFDIIAAQRERLGTKRGFIAVKPNCSIQSYTPALAAWMEYEPAEVVVSTYQAISGAGKVFADWPEMEGNISPSSGGEEEKSEQEPMKVFGALFNTFILVEYRDQLLLVDQHAVHERLLFDKLMKEHANERQPGQELLVPMIVSVTNREQRLLEDNREALENIGLSVEAFGEKDVAVRTIPVILGEAQTRDFVRDVIAELETGRDPTAEKKRTSLLQTACKHAVKGGEALTEEQIRSLLDEMIEKKVTPTCPHGRPLVVAISHRDLDKKFKRIQA